jgi:hypothetical protein
MLTVGLIIVFYCVPTESYIYIFVLMMAPLELVVASLKINQIISRVDLPSKKQKIFRIFTSSQVLDALSICLASIMFYLAQIISQFKNIFCSGPLILALLITIIKSAFTKRDVENMLIRMKVKLSVSSSL